ncbi:MAG: ABC transporter substrate-binding protein [Clostridiales bacterium]|nr:ABC transporter substrate-binding protein [Clostridiales bacterium]
MKRLLCCLLALALLMPALSLAQDAVTFTDSAGRSVQLPQNIERIAPSGPVAQMVLMSIAPERMVGLATPFDRGEEAYMANLKDLPVIGQLYGTRGDLNLEELARLDPQVIIDIGEPKGTVGEDMDALQEQIGIPCVHITMHLNDAGDAYRMLGELLGAQEKAQSLAAYCDEVYARAQDIMGKVGGNKASLLYSLGDAGLNVIARGSFHAEVLDLVADNAAVVDNPTSKGTGNEVDMEQLYLWEPGFIVFAPGSVYAKVGEDPLWQQLAAIREGRYVQAPQGPYNWMGFPASIQRLLGMIWLQKVLYPDIADYDLQAEISRYYELFYGRALTADQYDVLMAGALPGQ